MYLKCVKKLFLFLKKVGVGGKLLEAMHCRGQLKAACVPELKTVATVVKLPDMLPNQIKYSN